MNNGTTDKELVISQDCILSSLVTYLAGMNISGRMIKDGCNATKKKDEVLYDRKNIWFSFFL